MAEIKPRLKQRYSFYEIKKVKLLKKEGHKVVKKGKKVLVEGYEGKLVK